MFLIRYHLFRSKIFIFSEGLPARIAQLLGCPQKHLKLSKTSPPNVIISGKETNVLVSCVEVLPLMHCFARRLLHSANDEKLSIRTDTKHSV